MGNKFEGRSEKAALVEEIRWRYRFRNFSRAYSLLREALEREVEELNQLEREGVIQRFEYTFELSWQLLKDRLEYDGVIISPVTPRSVIRESAAAGIVDEGQTWIDMLTDRNRMSHTYNFDAFELVIRNIQSSYLAVLSELYQRLAGELLE